MKILYFTVMIPANENDVASGRIHLLSDPAAGPDTVGTFSSDGTSPRSCAATIFTQEGGPDFGRSGLHLECDDSHALKSAVLLVLQGVFGHWSVRRATKVEYESFARKFPADDDTAITRFAREAAEEFDPMIQSSNCDIPF